MKKMTKFFALALLAGAMVSCSTEDTASTTANGKVAVQFTGGISVNTRASGTTWDNGDRIGITEIDNDTQYGNVPFILKNGKFEAERKVIYIEDTRPILSAPTIRTTRREASSQPRPMPRRSRTSLPSTSSLLQEPRETKTARW